MYLLLAPAALFLACFYFYPLAGILRASLAQAAGVGQGGLGAGAGAGTGVGAGFGWWAAVAAAARVPGLGKIVGFTFYQAILSTALTLAIGLPGAYLLARFRFPGQGALRALSAVPFVLPTVVVATAWGALLGPRGWVNQAWMAAFHLDQPPILFVGTLGAVLLAHVFYNTTIVLRLVGDYWARLDPHLEAAASALGAGRAQVLWHVTLPLLAPAVTAAALLVFIFDFSSFGVILVLGGPQMTTLETEIYRQTVAMFNLPTAAVLSLLQLGCTLGLALAYRQASTRLALPLSPRPPESTRRPITTLRARVGATVLLAVLTLLLVSPLVALAVRSVTPLGPDRRGAATAVGAERREAATSVGSEPREAATSEGQDRRGTATTGDGDSGGYRLPLTLAYYRELTVNRRNSFFYVPPERAIRNSLVIAFATVILALALGLPAAWALTRRGLAVATFDALLMLPLGTSSVTLGLGFLVALDRPPLDLRASPLLLPLAHTLVALPFVVRTLSPALANLKPRLRQAAAVLGAGPVQVWRAVDLPLVARAVTVAAAFAFTISLGEFGATALLARPEQPTVPVVIYRLLGAPGTLNYGQALAMSTLLMLVCAASIVAIERFRVADVGAF